MKVCSECGNPLDDAGFTNCDTRATPCSRDRMAFDRQVEDIKAALTLPALASMEKNEMPECFEPTRASTVALSGLLMETLRQNDAMAKQLRHIKAQGGDSTQH